MAAKRITQSAINWVELATRVPPHQKHLFVEFKGKSDAYLRRVLDFPATPPAIDWSAYKTKVALSKVVDEFEKQYTALQIPYPSDTVSGELDKLESEVKAEINAFKQESNARIETYKKELAHLASLTPFEQMTMEDFKDCYPDQAVDPLNKPTFWPHEADDQIGYVPPEGVKEDAHH